MKMTKKITVKNIYDEVVTIEPIPYQTALKIIELHEVAGGLLEVAERFLRDNINDPNIKESMFYKRIMEKRNQTKKEEEELREKYNYWYVGKDNLIKRIKN